MELEKDKFTSPKAQGVIRSDYQKGSEYWVLGIANWVHLGYTYNVKI